MSEPAAQSRLHQPAPGTERITGLVLAGGQGRRMGGVEKGLQTLEGEALAARALRRLAPQVDHLLLNANRAIEAHARLGVPVVMDAQAGQFHGPLAGMLAGLRACATPWLAVVPCDAPDLPEDLVTRLLAAARQARSRVAVAATLEADGQTRLHPVCCLLRLEADGDEPRCDEPKDLAASLEDFLALGGRKVEAWLAGLTMVTVPFEQAAAFRNLNTQAELAERAGDQVAGQVATSPSEPGKAGPAGPSGEGAAALQGLLARASLGARHLVDPGPDEAALQILLQAAMRAPDHAGLVPWRLRLVRGAARAQLASLFEQAALAAGKSADDARADHDRALAAPLTVAVLARIDPGHPLVPAHEQWMAVGGAITNLLNAAHLLGYGGKMLSGGKVRRAEVIQAFCAPGEQLVGWITLGRPLRPGKPGGRGASAKPGGDVLMQDWPGGTDLAG